MAKERISKLWRDTIFMSGAGLFTALFGMVRGALLPKLISNPADYGLLLIVNLIAGYGAYTDLGASSGIYRQIPYLRGQKASEETLEQLRNSALGFVLLTGLLAAGAALLLGLGMIGSFSTVAVIILILAAVRLPLRNLIALLTNLHQAEQRFALLAKIEVYSTVGWVGGVLLGAYFWGVSGAVGVIVAVELVRVVVYWRTLGFSLKPILTLKPTRRLLSVGMPLTVATFLRFSMESMDKLFVAHFVGGESRGFLTLTLTVVMFINLLPGKLGTVLYPDIARQTGAGKLDALREKLLRYTEINAYLGAITAGLTVIAAHTLLPGWLPNYKAAIPLIDLYAPRLALYTTMLVGGNILINQLLERKQVKRWLILQVAFVLLSVAACSWALLRFGDAEGQVLANNVVVILYVLLLLYFSAGAVKVKPLRRLAFIGTVLLPILYAGGATLAVLYLIENLLARWSLIPLFLVGVAAFGLLLIPLLIIEEKRLGLLRTIKAKILKR